MLKLKRSLQWRNTDAGQKEGEKKNPGKNGNGCRQGAGKATTGTGSSCSRELPLKIELHQMSMQNKQPPAPALSITGACLSESSRELSSSSWAHMWLKGKCQDFCSRNSMITSSRLVQNQITGILLQNTAFRLSAFMIVRTNCTSPKYPEGLWSY